MLKRSLLVGLTVLGLSDVTARAVVTYGGTGRNVLAATDSVSGILPDQQGSYGVYLGTPISADYFVTAAHIYSGSITSLTTTDASGTTIVHPITSSVQIPGTDLTLNRVSTPFVHYTPIYNPATDGGALPVGQSLTVFGRGTARGAPVTVSPGPAGGNGWLWGTADNAKSWGTNNLEGVETINDPSSALNGAAFLVANFDNNGSANEATLADGDSGGGVFTFANGQWRLLGINSSVELFRLPAVGGGVSGSDLAAAIYDGRGLYEETAAGVYTYQSPTGPIAIPQSWFSSYVPNSLSFINANVPEPTMVGIAAVGAMLIGRRRQV